MFVLIAGGGKVGANLARTLRDRHEVVLIEQDPCPRATSSRRSSAIASSTATRRSCTSSSRPAIERPPDIVVAATGDDEDNIVICQLARERYGVAKVVARVNDPRNQQHFDLLGISPTVSATASIMALIEHEVPQHDLVHLLELRKENLEIVEVEIESGRPCVGTPGAGPRDARRSAAHLGHARRARPRSLSARPSSGPAIR